MPQKAKKEVEKKRSVPRTKKKEQKELFFFALVKKNLKSITQIFFGAPRRKYRPKIFPGASRRENTPKIWPGLGLRRLKGRKKHPGFFLV